jgi:hypothetical protein
MEAKISFSPAPKPSVENPYFFILFLRQQKEHLFRLFKYVSQRNAAANKRLVVLLD